MKNNAMQRNFGKIIYAPLSLLMMPGLLIFHDVMLLFAGCVMTDLSFFSCVFSFIDLAGLTTVSFSHSPAPCSYFLALKLLCLPVAGLAWNFTQYVVLHLLSGCILSLE